MLIFSSIDTFKKITFYPIFGGGLKYRGISLEFSLKFSGSIDAGKSDYTDESITYYENFTYFSVIDVSLKINLVSKNLNKNKLTN
jgi:hypothetical protein